MATLYGPHVTLPHVGHCYQQFRTPERSMDKYIFRVWPGNLKCSPVGLLSTLLTEILHCFFKNSSEKRFAKHIFKLPQ